MVSTPINWLIIFAAITIVVIFGICGPISLIITRRVLKKTVKSSNGKVTNVTPVSLLEVKVSLPTKLIFHNESIQQKYDPSELAQLSKTRIGEGTLGTLYKAVLDSGSIVTVRKIKEGLVGSDDLEAWIKFFGGLRDIWLSKMQLGFWYDGEAFIAHEYFCLGSLEQLLHGCEGTQFTPLSWGVRLRIAFCAAKAVVSLHQVTRKGSNLVCGVIKSSNILIQLDFSACLSGYETPYLIPLATIVRRNPGRVAPELTTTQNSPKVFTRKSDVYSFGILLLEIVTGKKPTVTDLGEYVKEKRKREGLKGVCDKKMVSVDENVVDLLRIAEVCLVHNPKERPNMERVVVMIQGLIEGESLYLNETNSHLIT